MKKLVCCLLAMSRSLSLLTGCAPKQDAAQSAAASSASAAVSAAESASAEVSAAGSASAEVSPSGSTAPTVEGQTLSMETLGNARELGGYTAEDGRTVKHGVLLRTAKLSDSSEADLKKLVEEYSLATVLDFRSDMEITTAQDPDLEGVENLHLPIMDMELMGERYGAMKEELGEDAQNADQMTLLMAAVKSGIINPNMYVEFLQGQAGKDGYRRMFEELLALPEGKSLLFHCTQGKDRTGVGAMLILSALGVDQETIMADFLLTNEFNAEKIAKEQEMVKQLSEDPQEQELLLLAMDYVSETTLRNALDYLNSEYGSPVGYITQELGLTEDQIAELQNKFLE